MFKDNVSLQLLSLCDKNIYIHAWSRHQNNAIHTPIVLFSIGIYFYISRRNIIYKHNPLGFDLDAFPIKKLSFNKLEP